MQRAKQYATTSCPVSFPVLGTTDQRERWDDKDIAPTPPEGLGWSMVGSTYGEGRLYWFWTREA